MIWNNLAFGQAIAANVSDAKSEGRQSSVKSLTNELVQRNSRKGESEDSDTDSEDEGYDSDVKREHQIDYNKNIFVNEIKRPSAETVLKMYNKVNNSKIK